MIHMMLMTTMAGPTRGNAVDAQVEREHRLVMRSKATSACPRVSHGATDFFVCTPPGAVTVKFMQTGVEWMITNKIVATVVTDGGWKTRPRVVDWHE